MICINTLADVAGVISDPDLDDDLRTLIAQRGWQIYADRQLHLSKDTRIVVIEAGDTPEVINFAVQFALTGDDAEEPNYDRLEDHEGWFEIVVTDRAGRDLIIFAEDSCAVDLAVHWLCLSHFWIEVAGR
ncbi:MAG: hypothetical protein ACK4MH_06750 [Brevundimonas sp.]|uniref:hypothetical protein n=1 Tax=Brevundimonas sp. TaxID=1871086 RepID=UPI003919A43E